MDIQEAIDLAVKEDCRISIKCADDRETLLSKITDQKGCGITKCAPNSKEVTIWPPSECTAPPHQEGNHPVPTYLLPLPSKALS